MKVTTFCPNSVHAYEHYNNKTLCIQTWEGWVLWTNRHANTT